MKDDGYVPGERSYPKIKRSRRPYKGVNELYTGGTPEGVRDMIREKVIALRQLERDLLEDEEE